MRKWPTRVAVFLIVIGVGAALGWSLRRPPHVAATEEQVEVEGEEADTLARPRPARAPRAIEPPSMRRRIQEVTDRAAVSTTKDQLPGYLEELLARARANGEVTALESEVGRDLIKQLGGDFQTEMKFVARVNDLARELRHEDHPPATTQGEALARLDSIAQELDGEKDARKRGDLSGQYLEQAALLGPEQKARMMTRLNQLVAPPPALPPAASELDARLAAVQSAGGDDRTVAVEAFLDAVRQLPPEEKLAQMRRLDTVLPRGGSGPAPH